MNPLFLTLRGAIFDRWLTILQQYDLEIYYKQAEQMVVADALSRCHPNPYMPILEASPDEHVPHFDSFDEPTCNIKLPSGECLDDLLPERHSEVNDVDIHSALEYDAYRETDSDICHPKVSIKPQRHKRTHKFIFQKRNQQYHMN